MLIIHYTFSLLRFLVVSSSQSFSEILSLKAILICRATSPTYKMYACTLLIYIKTFDGFTLFSVEFVITSSTNGLATANGIIASKNSMQVSLVSSLSFEVLGNLTSRRIFQLSSGSGAT